MKPRNRDHRTLSLAAAVLLLLVGPGCVSWDPIVLPMLRWLAALFS